MIIIIIIIIIIINKPIQSMIRNNNLFKIKIP